MQYVTFIIAVVGFILSIYTFVSNRLARRPRLALFRFTPERLVVDDDFDTLHIYTDADFIVTNLSDRPNTVIRMEVSACLDGSWFDGVITGKRLSESTRTRTDYSAAEGVPRHHNEIIHEWVSADVCPIMLSPQASGIPNQGISLRLDFQSTSPIPDLSDLALRLTLHDQYGAKHVFPVAVDKLSASAIDRYPKFHDDEVELGKQKCRVPAEHMDALVRIVYRKYEQDLSQAAISVRRYYPLYGDRTLKHVSHLGRDGYAYNSYRARDFKKHLSNGGNGRRVLDTADGFTFSFSTNNGLPDVLTIVLPEAWTGAPLEIALPEDFSRLCAPEPRSSERQESE